MATITSSLGNKSFQPGLKEYVVPDESIPEEEIVNPYAKNQVNIQSQPQMQLDRDAIRESLELERRAKMQAEAKVSPAAKKRIEMLCGMSMLTREVDIDNNIFTLRTLKSKENRQALVDAVKYDGTIEFSFELRKQILARSIEKIAGVEIDAFLGSFDFKAKLEFIDELDEAVLDKLYNEYLSLNKEIKDKYSAKNEVEVKEVIEDIKK